jgi:hypothetical protein
MSNWCASWGVIDMTEWFSMTHEDLKRIKITWWHADIWLIEAYRFRLYRQIIIILFNKKKKFSEC